MLTLATSCYNNINIDYDHFHIFVLDHFNNNLLFGITHSFRLNSK